MSPPVLQFFGAAGTVSGSRHLLEVGRSRLLVDCGLFQGEKRLRLKNWDDFPVPPASIDAVVLTHAHLDHSGYLPRLVHRGFSGPIYATAPTADLLSLLLYDSAKCQAEDAAYANKKGYSRHRPPDRCMTNTMSARPCGSSRSSNGKSGSAPPPACGAGAMMLVTCSGVVSSKWKPASQRSE